MVEEWPVAAPGTLSELAVDALRTRASIGAGDRIAAVRADFFLNPVLRLTEQERALITAMLHGLIGNVADELRVRLTDELAAMTECGPDVLVKTLGDSGLLSSDALIALLIRRADSARAAQSTAQNVASGSLLSGWSGDEDPDIAAAAMALVIARGRSRDRLGRAGLTLADCQADLATDLVHAVAAALARRCHVPSHGAVSAAANDFLSRHDEEGRADALESRLVRLLEAAGRLEPPLVLALGRAGEAGLLAETLARIAGISGDDGWILAIDPGGGGLPLLLRLAGQPREVAATIFVEFGEAFGVGDPAEAIDLFDSLSDDQTENERHRLRLPAAYRRAMKALTKHG